MNASKIERQNLNVDIACVGFGPACAGFLTTLSRALTSESGDPLLKSRAMEGMPLQVVCYERADDIGFGVSGVVTRARSIKKTFPSLNPADVPMSHPVTHEKVLYLMDPHGASKRSWVLKIADAVLKPFCKKMALDLPIIPPFLSKEGGFVLSMGQFTQWVGSQLMAQGLVQIWPTMPVQEALIEKEQVKGIRLVDQGVAKNGQAEAGFMPGMDVHADLTVVGDGPVGAVGRQLDDHFGMPEGHHKREWAVGMKMVVELPKETSLKPGMVFHTFGYPEPDIFGFLYVYENNLASLGIFVPSWFQNPVRTSYRYLQHWITHPYLWQHLNGAVMRSWGAKSLQESGRRGEPFLVGDGYARIGEGSGSTNVLTGSGVDEAWETGVLLAEGVIELWKENKPMTRENLEAAYVARRRKSWLDKESRIAERSRDGFQFDFTLGLLGMAVAGFTGGFLSIPAKPRSPYVGFKTIEEYFAKKIPAEEIGKIRAESAKAGVALHEAIMDRLGWPKISYDGKLLMSHQDALLVGGKVQAPAGYADHVVFLYPHLCETCGTKICIELCSAQAIMPGESGGKPQFDREKCVHCGACLWNCSQIVEGNADKGNIQFAAGAGGLHSAEN
ncbi:MAG: 4Fe-4S ferredoxin [Candidatus Omnitrophota bacterium]